ncbi:MAG: DUF3090 domain-containing protein [Marmoricola sp.]
MTRVHLFDPPERFVAGTVGMPGHRTFFLQARTGSRIVSVALEKQQVAILAERVDELLDEVLQTGATSTMIPALAPTALIDNDPLEQPIEEEFRAGTITLSWDERDERIVIEVFPFQPVEVEDGPTPIDEAGLTELPIAEPEPEELFVVRLTPALARTFATRAAAVVGQGRASCPFCGGPMDVEGHLCPRANGFRRSA